MAPLHMISVAWCDDRHQILGQRLYANRGNGIGGIPEPLDPLHLEVATVMTAAKGCQCAMVKKIRDRGRITCSR